MQRRIKSIVLLPAISFLFFTSMSASEELKHGEIGGSLYGTVISFDDGSLADDDLSGLSFFGTGIINQHFAVRGLMAFQSHNEVSGIDSRIIEATLLGGGGLGTRGWKGYGGVGFFRDKWDGYGSTETFSGLQLTAGFGYNWEPVALDAWWTFRDASDYESFVNDVFGASFDATAASFGLGLSGRF